MSCLDCRYIRPARFCSLQGETVKNPNAGTCRYEKQDHEEIEMAKMNSYGWVSTKNGTVGVYSTGDTVELRTRVDRTGAPAEATVVLGKAGLRRLHALLGQALRDMPEEE
jgi:hypothetical protein